MKFPTLLLLLCFLAACDNDNSSKTTSQPQNNLNKSESDYIIPTTSERSPTGKLYPLESGLIANKEAVIPPQCYTKHEQQYNPCMTCHQNYPYGSRPNSISDGNLQQIYAFSDFGFTNRWNNLFEDRRDRIAEISNQEAIDYIYTDNYSTLIDQLETTSDWTGPIPKITNLHLGAEAFDEQGFAKDGSHWVAFNYKPLPSTFWPTNGSTDDVMIKLSEAFRTNNCSSAGYSKDTYLANLSIVEMAIQDLDKISTPKIDENNICEDINGDAELTIITEIPAREFYVGQAQDTAVKTMLYPLGTEFLHTVRYVGITEDEQIIIPPRMKEVRYMVKTHFYDIPALRSKYGNEQQEKIDGLLPKYNYQGIEGSSNEFGWQLWGFIEAKDGHLRLQSQEESLFCMGCHTTIGSTIDQTFSFARKITGAEGWGYINLKNMKDAPNVGGTEGEILDYLKTVGGGDEFRQNDEMISRWFKADGTVDEEKVKNADVYTLTSPSIERALMLNKAYMTIVEDQDFVHGRDANITPAKNVYKAVDETAPLLPYDKARNWDIRLNWATD